LNRPNTFRISPSRAHSRGLVADHDHTAVTDRALKAFERALEPKRLVMIKGRYFDPYRGSFETASSAAVDLFKTHL
jgi:hypothetical protein